MKKKLKPLVTTKHLEAVIRLKDEDISKLHGTIAEVKAQRDRLINAAFDGSTCRVQSVDGAISAIQHERDSYRQMEGRVEQRIQFVEGENSRLWSFIRDLLGLNGGAVTDLETLRRMNRPGRDIGGYCPKNQ